MYKDPQEGDMLMDAPTVSSWRELTAYVCDTDTNYWRSRVRALKQPRLEMLGAHTEPETTTKFTIS